MQETILKKKLRFYVIDGYTVARAAGMGNRINTIMQTCFFAISGVLPREEAIAAIKKAIQNTYGKRGEAVVQKKLLGRGSGRSRILHEVQVPDTSHQPHSKCFRQCSAKRPEFVRERSRHDHHRQRRFASRQRHADGWNIPHRHRKMGKAQYRPGNSGLGRRALHPVRQVRAGLPARRDSREGI